MTDSKALATLQHLFRRETRSLLQYVLDSFPWTPAGEDRALSQVRKLILSERDALAKIGQFLVRQRIPLPQAGTYPVEFTSFNFIELGHLIHLLIGEQEKAIAWLDSEIAVSEGEDRKLIESFRDLKSRHLDTLRRLAQPEPAVA